MAGYTSRIFQTLTIPSLFAVVSVAILFMRKWKKQTARAPQRGIETVEHFTDCNINSENIVSCEVSAGEKDIEVLVPEVTDLKGCSSSEEEKTVPDMLLKEKKTSSHTDIGLQTDLLQVNMKCKGKHSVESKACGNPATCTSEAAGRVTNGLSHNGDKRDNIPSTSRLQNGASSTNGSSNNCSHTDLVNGLGSLELSEKECRNSKPDAGGSEFVTNSSDCKEVSTHVKLNGKMPYVEESAVQTEDMISDSIDDQHQSGKDSDLCELSCETHCIPKVSTPDSGVSAELHESDAASSSMSEPSSECALNGLGDMLKSPVTSVSSNDSGKDCSESHFESDQIVPGTSCEVSVPSEPAIEVYEFEIPQELCGYLIGKNGRHVKYIKEESNADIYIKRHPLLPHLKTCAVTGTQEEIEIALSVIRERFPSEIFPELSLEPINLLQPECTLPVTLKLSLPEGVTFDAILSATVTPGHFFLQQPTHPTYHTLPLLTTGMSAWYNEFETPKLVRVVCDAIVAVPFSGSWYRAQVSAVHPETQQCTVRFLDYGGYGTYNISQLRQMKFEFAQIPFQATECYLGSVTYPEGEEGWSADAKALFEELAQGQIIQGYIVGYDECGIPYVHLYTAQGASAVFINRELVNAGFARWTDKNAQSS